MKRKSSLWIAGMAVLLLAGLLPEAGHSATAAGQASAGPCNACCTGRSIRCRGLTPAFQV